jgi:hypothetical protein
MPLAERYWHWQQADDEELVGYTPEPWLSLTGMPEDTAGTPILSPQEPPDAYARLDP